MRKTVNEALSKIHLWLTAMQQNPTKKTEIQQNMQHCDPEWRFDLRSLAILATQGLVIYITKQPPYLCCHWLCYAESQQTDWNQTPLKVGKAKFNCNLGYWHWTSSVKKETRGQYLALRPKFCWPRPRGFGFGLELSFLSPPQTFIV